MRDDLLHAQASIDWAVAKLPAFAEQIETWLRENVDCRIEQLEPPIPYRPLIAKLKAALPLSFNVEAGAYINAIRSGLDILATSLAIRYGVPKPEAAYFPIAASAAAFATGSYKGAKFVKGLPCAQRAIIEALKPYKGGNSQLFALHQLDVMRKHKRLLSVTVVPGFTVTVASEHCDLRPMGHFYVGNVAAGLQMRDFVLFGAGALCTNRVPVLGLIRNGAPDYKIEFTQTITLSESTSTNPPEVIGAINEFASLAHSIVSLFDG